MGRLGPAGRVDGGREAAIRTRIASTQCRADSPGMGEEPGASATWRRRRTRGRRSAAAARRMCSWRKAMPSPPRRGSRARSPRRARAPRSGSRPPSPRRGRVEERGGRLSAVVSKAVTMSASSSRATGRPESASSRRRRRHSGPRRARRAITRSSKELVRLASETSRRAARSSSATSGRPRDRSATRTRAAPVGRSPSIAWTRSASSARSNGPIPIRSGRDDVARRSPRPGWR